MSQYKDLVDATIKDVMAELLNELNDMPEIPDTVKDAFVQDLQPVLDLFGGVIEKYAEIFESYTP